MEKMGINIKSKLFSIIRLTSPEYVILGAFGFIAGFFISADSFELNISFLFGLASVILILAGYNSLNAIYDIDLDKINKPYRPLPKKEVSVIAAFLETIILFVFAIVFSFFINKFFVYLLIISILFAILYSVPPINLKKRFVLGSLTAVLLYQIFPMVFGWISGKGISVNFLYFIMVMTPFFLVGGILKDFEDIRGDSTNKVHSFVSKLKYPKTIKILYTLCSTSIILLIILVLYQKINSFYLFTIVFIILVMLNIYLLNKKRNIKHSRKIFHYGLIIIILFDLFIILQLIL